MVRRGLERGAGDTLSEPELIAGLLNNVLELWAVHRDAEILGGLVLLVEQRSKGPALVVLMIASGSGRGLGAYAPKVLALIRDYAELIGAYTIESVARPGAARLLTRLGCRPKALIMELRDGRKHT